MKAFAFSIVATGLAPDEPGFADRFFEAGCDDATVSHHKGVVILDFQREAKSLGHALASAIAAVEAAGATVDHVEPDDLVSLSDIATRSGLTRAAISLYGKGERGKGFPPPVARVMTDGPLWDWLDVARWLHGHGRLDRGDVLAARLIRRANLWLAARRSRRPGRDEAHPRRTRAAA